MIGSLAVEDEIRPESAEAVKALHELGVRVAMITGDSRTVAVSVVRKLGIDDIAAQVLPADKASAVQRFRAEGKEVAMVGGGVNDAPALATADVGIAIGADTDVAVESGGIVLVRSDPRDVVIALPRATYRKMLQNLMWATVYNLIAIPAAAGLFIRWRVDLPMSVGAMAMSLFNVIVALTPSFSAGGNLRITTNPTSAQSPSEETNPGSIKPDIAFYRDEVRSRNRMPTLFATALRGLLSSEAELNNLSPLRTRGGGCFSLEVRGYVKLNYAGHLSALLRLEGAPQLPIGKSKSGLPRAAFLERQQAASRSPDHGCHQSDSVSTLRRQTTSSGMPKQADDCPVVLLNRSAMTRSGFSQPQNQKREIECIARNGEQIANALIGDTSTARRP